MWAFNLWSIAVGLAASTASPNPFASLSPFGPLRPLDPPSPFDSDRPFVWSSRRTQSRQVAKSWTRHYPRRALSIKIRRLSQRPLALGISLADLRPVVGAARPTRQACDGAAPKGAQGEGTAVGPILATGAEAGAGTSRGVRRISGGRRRLNMCFHNGRLTGTAMQTSVMASSAMNQAHVGAASSV